MHIRQNKLALDPVRRLSTSDALGLSCIPKRTGATTRTSCWRETSNVTNPVVSSIRRSVIIGSTISRTSTRLEHVMRWMFHIWEFSAFNKPVHVNSCQLVDKYSRTNSISFSFFPNKAWQEGIHVVLMEPVATSKHMEYPCSHLKRNCTQGLLGRYML